MKRLGIELHDICDQVTSSSILDHDTLGSSMAHIRAGLELQKASTSASELKHFILLNSLIPTSTLEGEPRLQELCNIVRFGGLGDREAMGGDGRNCQTPPIVLCLKICFSETKYLPCRRKAVLFLPATRNPLHPM